MSEADDSVTVGEMVLRVLHGTPTEHAELIYRRRYPAIKDYPLHVHVEESDGRKFYRVHPAVEGCSDSWREVRIDA